MAIIMVVNICFFSHFSTQQLNLILKFQEGKKRGFYVPFLSLRKMSDDCKQFVITHQKLLSNLDELLEERTNEANSDEEDSDDEFDDDMEFDCEILTEIIERDDVLGLYVDEKYLVLLCLTQADYPPYGSDRTVTVRCADTFAVLCSIPINVGHCGYLEALSSDYSNGFLVTKFPEGKSNVLSLK